ncbi:hypothetical protein KO529_08155 [Arenibacter algicola]|nr:hypothetical protein [Arenibacter algicola]MBU2904756.1 hypothetical protein [Arenibacter algicola]
MSSKLGVFERFSSETVVCSSSLVSVGRHLLRYGIFHAHCDHKKSEVIW